MSCDLPPWDVKFPMVSFRCIYGFWWSKFYKKKMLETNYRHLIQIIPPNNGNYGNHSEGKTLIPVLLLSLPLEIMITN